MFVKIEIIMNKVLLREDSFESKVLSNFNTIQTFICYDFPILILIGIALELDSIQ